VILAHQDDEVGIFTRIRHEVAGGNRVWCVYLTDGATSVQAAVRDAESLSVLSGLGVSAEQVAFIRDESGRIADGTLMLQLDRARRSLSAWALAADTQFARIYTIDWEGGHADHDACHVVAMVFARDLGIKDIWTFSLYNAYRRPRGLFRVFSFVPASEPIARRKLNARETLAASRVVFAYPSQFRTWLALGPFWVAKTILSREERLRRPNVKRLRNRPHDGPLLYETLFKVDSEKMLAASAELRHELLEPT
jgi:LmbE family N-acetylglucosaminyl deacetylase